VEALLSVPFVDHCRFAVRQPFGEVIEWMVEWFAGNFAEADDFTRADVVRRDHGPAGNFSSQVVVQWRGLTLFRVLVASQSTRGVSHVIVDGSSCSMVHPHAWHVLADHAERRGWRLKRTDSTVDDDRGVIRSIDDVAALYYAGDLDPIGPGGRRIFDPRDPRNGELSTGWLAYIGKRGGSRFARVYQKHAEVLAKRGAEAAASVPVQRVRWEVESQADGGVLSWDAVRFPASVLASHSRAFASVANGASPRALYGRARSAAEADLWRQLGNCRNSYGPHIAQAYWALGGGVEAAEQLVWTLMRPIDRDAVPGVVEVAGGAVPDRDYVSQ
jgi:hypothetical protein